MLHAAHDSELEGESKKRRAEHDDAVHVAVEPRRAARGVGHRNRHVQQKEQDHERLDGAELPRLVEAGSPHRGDAESQHQAERIEAVPRPVERDREDARIEHQVVAEQRHAVRAHLGGQHRRQEAAGDAQYRDPLRVLPDGEEAGERNHRSEQHEARRALQEGDGVARADHGHVEQAHAAALQRLRKGGTLGPQAPTDAKEHGRREDYADEALAERKRAGVVVGISQQESRADEQHDDADPHGSVVAHEPYPDASPVGRC